MRQQTLIRRLAIMSLIGCYDPAYVLVLPSLPEEKLKKEFNWALKEQRVRRPKILYVSEAGEYITFKGGRFTFERTYTILVENPVLKDVKPLRTLIKVRESEILQVLFDDVSGSVLSLNPTLNGDGLLIKVQRNNTLLNIVIGRDGRFKVEDAGRLPGKI